MNRLLFFAMGAFSSFLVAYFFGVAVAMPESQAVGVGFGAVVIFAALSNLSEQKP